jgi:putative flavoprotein involved in K+ transport
MADYLQSYAVRFDLPIRTGIRVDGLSRHGNRYVVTAGNRRFEAEHVAVAMARYVAVAMARYQVDRAPQFARELDPRIVQFHSRNYRNLEQLRDGGVLIVGAGNSGAEIALETARKHRTCVSGRDAGHIPFHIHGLAGRLFLTRFVLRFVFHRVLTVKTLLGRKARPKILSQGGPLIRVKPDDLRAAGVDRVPKVVGTREGLPLLEDGRVLDVANVIWCTGFDTGFAWIRLPVFSDDGMPKHESGVATGEPGLYFVGLPFIYSFSSTMIHGVGRDAERIAQVIAGRAQTVKSEAVGVGAAQAQLS